MPAFACYALKSEIGSEPIEALSDFLVGDVSLATYGPTSSSDFEAQLWVTEAPPHPARWGSFLQEGFPELPVPRASSASALLVVRVEASPSHYFALAFGVRGRHLLRDEAPIRGFGLKVALNLMYPGGDGDVDVDRLIGFEAKRRTDERLRQKHQAARATTFEVLALDRFRDVVNAATGRPANDSRWGRRVTGGDALNLSIQLTFDGLGQFCRELLEVAKQEDYKRRFPWLENMQPVTEPDVLSALEDMVIASLQGGVDEIELAPPEVVEWHRVDHFRFPQDSRTGVTHPELRMQDYLASLGESGRAALSVQGLRSAMVRAIDGTGDEQYSWPVWRCMYGDLTLGGDDFVLDDGEFFSVSHDYLRETEAFIDQLEVTLPLPACSPTMVEQDYNAYVVESSGGSALLLDRETVRSTGITNPIEICDVFTDTRQLIHVKRHLGSRDLSHLFSQGFVSADLLQTNEEFRGLVIDKIESLADQPERFGLVEPGGITSSEFEVVFAIVADFAGRSVGKALPFFSKVNLRRTAEVLMTRGFRVSCGGIQTDPSLIH